VAYASEPWFLVCHGLRIKGFATPSSVAEVSGLEAGTVVAELERLAGDGYVNLREGRITGWSLTPAGRGAHADACGAELAAAGARNALDEAYRGFLAVNAGLLRVCTDWQLRADAPAGAQVLNDHTDPDYDAGVVRRLGDIDAAVQPVVEPLGQVLERFRRYGTRLGAARRRVENGEHDWFTGAMIESYHTVWFELHEDLLATLGIDRASEAKAGSGVR